MSYLTNTSTHNIPKPPRAQTFDGFLTRQRKQWYDRLFTKRRRQQIPVKDLSPNPKPLNTLSSYMIDPRYLSPATKSAITAGATPAFIDAQEAGELSPIDKVKHWGVTVKSAMVAAGTASVTAAHEGWRKLTSLIPQRYYKTFYSIDHGAKTYILSGTQKLATVGATATIALSAVLTLALLHSAIETAIPSPSAPITAQNQGSNEDSSTARTQADPAVSSITPSATDIPSTSSPQAAGSVPAANHSTPAPYTPQTVDAAAPATPTPSAPVSTPTVKLPSTDQLTSPLTSPQASTPSSSSPLAPVEDVVNNTTGAVVDIVDHTTQLLR